MCYDLFITTLTNTGETMSKWFFINFLIFIFMIWKVTTGYMTTYTLLGGLGVLFILYNWSRHALFATIRSNISRKRKIKYANISKKLQRVHKWTGTTALMIILAHATIINYYFDFQLGNVKMITGLLALLTLIGVVIFGWLRHIHTTVVRRYIHWGLAYALIFFVVLHLLS